MRSLIFATMALALPCPTQAKIGLEWVTLMQAGSSMNSVEVAPKIMLANCLTRVSPNYPKGAGNLREAASVLVKVVISKTGTVSPIRAVSGPPLFEAEAMNAVRLWRYKPFVRDGEPVDVTTNVEVDFTPGKPGGMITHPKL